MEKRRGKFQTEEADLKSRIIGKLPWDFQLSSDQYRKQSENNLMRKLRGGFRKDVSEGTAKRSYRYANSLGCRGSQCLGRRAYAETEY